MFREKAACVSAHLFKLLPKALFFCHGSTHGQAWEHITLPTKNGSFCEYTQSLGQVDGICKHWRKPQVVQLNIFCQLLYTSVKISHFTNCQLEYLFFSLLLWNMPLSLVLNGQLRMNQTWVTETLQGLRSQFARKSVLHFTLTDSC